MRDYAWLSSYCLNRFGGPAELEARLPQPRSAEALRALGDDRYLSLIALRVFRAGLKHSLVDAKWPAFEEAFFAFDPHKVVLMGAEHLERLMQDSRLIRHLGKLKSVPRNAQFVLDVARERGSFGQLIADWPSSDIVGLWKYLAKHGSQLGGLSAPRPDRHAPARPGTSSTARDVRAACRRTAPPRSAAPRRCGRCTDHPAHDRSADPIRRKDQPR